jgi:hypothetical protein
MTGYMTNDAHVARLQELHHRADRRRAARPGEAHTALGLRRAADGRRRRLPRLRPQSAYRVA